MKVLLHPECTALQNFEGLMALTNLAAIDDAHRFAFFWILYSERAATDISVIFYVRELGSKIESRLKILSPAPDAASKN